MNTENAPSEVLSYRGFGLLVYWFIGYWFWFIGYWFWFIGFGFGLLVLVYWFIGYWFGQHARGTHCVTLRLAPGVTPPL